MRIAIVTPEVGWSAGVPHVWAALANALAREHDVHVYAARVERTGLVGVRIHRVPSIRLGWLLRHLTFCASVRLIFSLRKLFRRRPFDLVLGTGALVSFADLVTLHFYQRRELELLTSGAFPHDKAGMGGVASIDYHLYSRWCSRLESRFFGGAGARRTRIVAVSQNVRDDILARYDLGQDRIRVVPNGVDVERFHPRNRERFRSRTRTVLGLRPDETAILFVGNSWGRKGLRAALDAMAGLGPYDARLVVVGTGNPRAFMAGRSSHEARNVTFVHERTSAIERYYAAADIFLLPTLYEPFGLTVLEALASGVPCILSALAGAADVLEDGVDVLLLEDPSDPEEIIARLRLLLDAPELALRIADNGVRKARQYSWASIAELLLQEVA
ncbi:MAG: glycosyltransferase family 4 protein [Chloroflexi bacterium]|nr:glycosyltransferase family 4 protein [Chloroflexota bacterium]